MKKIILALLLLAGTASATPTPTPVNLGTIFGSPVPTQGATPSIRECQWQTTKNPITANGVDQSTISLLDDTGATMGPVAIEVETNNGTLAFQNVQYPSTVVSTVTGVWKVTVVKPGWHCVLTFVAQ